MRKTYKLAILYPASVPWFAKCLDGIRHYAREHGEWCFICSPPTLSGAEESALTVRNMLGWKGDALMICSNEEKELRAARRMGIPVVNFGGGLRDSCGIPRVMVDHYQAGALAASHLLERGLRHLAFFGWSGLWYSEQRRQGFIDRAAREGVSCDSFLRTAGEDFRLKWPERVAGPFLRCTIIALNSYPRFAPKSVCMFPGTSL